MERIKNLFLVAGVLCIFSVILAFQASNNDDKIPIGTVIYSVMPPEYFISENPGWVMVDGRKLDSNSKLSLMLETYSVQKMDSIPNLLGMFIRSSNYKNDGIDPDSLRLVGSYQDYATALSKNPMVTKGKSIDDELSNHQHKTYFMREGAEPTRGYWKNNKHRAYIPFAKVYRVNKWTNPHYVGPDFRNIMDPGGKHLHNIKTIVDEGGDVETRPKNISLYTYIKVN